MFLVSTDQIMTRITILIEFKANVVFYVGSKIWINTQKSFVTAQEFMPHNGMMSNIFTDHTS